MGLPIAGQKKKPSAPATHKPLELDKLMRLASFLDEAAEEGPLSEERFEEIAEDEGVKRSELLAGLCASDAELECEEESRFVFCAGGCQGWGALGLIESLFELRDERRDEGKKLFSMGSSSCLDRCEHAPCSEVHGPSGRAVLDKASPEDLAEALSELLG